MNFTLIPCIYQFKFIWWVCVCIFDAIYRCQFCLALTFNCVFICPKWLLSFNKIVSSGSFYVSSNKFISRLSVLLFVIIILLFFVIYSLKCTLLAGYYYWFLFSCFRTCFFFLSISRSDCFFLYCPHSIYCSVCLFFFCFAITFKSFCVVVICNKFFLISFELLISSIVFFFLILLLLCVVFTCSI